MHGYEKGTKGYRLLDINTNRIQVSKDVTFLEHDPHSSKEIQCDGDLVEDQLSEADEEDATCTLIENRPEREEKLLTKIWRLQTQRKTQDGQNAALTENLQKD